MPNPIPTKAREGVHERSRGRCERCGGRGGEIHHRRSRSVRDAHCHCLCNLVFLCNSCHRWAHANPYAAIDEGVIIPRFAHHPSGWSLLHYQGKRFWPTCEGELSTVETKEE
jgi:5-methylcytosine-specific restriction endonuclease McrA